MTRIRRFLICCVLLLPCMLLAAILYRNTRGRVVSASGPAVVPTSTAPASAVPTSAVVSTTESVVSTTESVIETAESAVDVRETVVETAESAVETTESVVDAGEIAVSGAVDDWGLSFPVEGEPPVGNAAREELLPFDAYYVGDTTKKVIYLTFDCGYENGNTAAILDALRKHHAPGAFFVVGNMIQTAPELIQRMRDEGHIVGNHTLHHPDMSAISAIEDFEEELAGVETLYREVTGEELPRYYRPPRGKYSRENLKQAQALGYRTIFWSLAYVDWYQDNQPTKEQAYAKLLPRIHNGAIVLLHSTSSTNAAILDELLSKWEEMGFTFASLDALPVTTDNSPATTNNPPAATENQPAD